MDEALRVLKHSQFPLWKKASVRKVPIGIQMCHLGERVMQVNQNCYCCPLRCMQSQTFSPPQQYVELLCWTTRLPQGHYCPWVIVKTRYSLWGENNGCCCAVTKSCPTLCDHHPLPPTKNCSTPGFPVFHYLPEFAQIHDH